MRLQRFSNQWLIGVLLGSFLGVNAIAGPAVERPSLVVMISVDGLGWQRLAEYRSWYQAGLKRLLDEGLVETGARFRHLNSETGPGHASLSTGAPPSVHGIIANRWLAPGPDGALRSVYCTAQPAVAVPGNPPMFYRELVKDGRIWVFASQARMELWQRSGEPGAATVKIGFGPNQETVVFDTDDAQWLYAFRHGAEPGSFLKGTIAGPANVRVATLGDRLVEQYPTSRVVSVSGKDRAAIFLAGHNPTLVSYWFDTVSGRFVTSTAFDSSTGPGSLGKSIVDEFNQAEMGTRLPGRFGLVWRRLTMPAALPSPTAVPARELADFQIPVNGLFFDHDLALNPSGYFYGIYTSPDIDELVADLAIAFLDNPSFRLGRGETPDELSISFSAQDMVSHNYGPESEENLDVLRRLDVQLGRVFSTLDEVVGRQRWVAGFSADHGFTPIPEHERLRAGAPVGGRLVDGKRVTVGVRERLNRRLDEVLCLAPGAAPIVAIEGWNVYYARPAAMRTIAGDCGAPDRLVGAAEIDAALPHVTDELFAEELSGVYLTSRQASWPADDDTTEFVRNDLDAERSGDAFLIPRIGVLMHWDPGRGAGHGSLHDYDTHVPLIFLGPMFPRESRNGAVTPYDLAPTLATTVGVTLPQARGHDLMTAPAVGKVGATR